MRSVTRISILPFRCVLKSTAGASLVRLLGENNSTRFVCARDLTCTRPIRTYLYHMAAPTTEVEARDALAAVIAAIAALGKRCAAELARSDQQRDFRVGPSYRAVRQSRQVVN